MNRVATDTVYSLLRNLSRLSLWLTLNIPYRRNLTWNFCRISHMSDLVLLSLTALGYRVENTSKQLWRWNDLSVSPVPLCDPVHLSRSDVPDWGVNDWPSWLRPATHLITLHSCLLGFVTGALLFTLWKGIFVLFLIWQRILQLWRCLGTVCKYDWWPPVSAGSVVWLVEGPVLVTTLNILIGHMEMSVTVCKVIGVPSWTWTISPISVRCRLSSWSVW